MNNKRIIVTTLASFMLVGALTLTQNTFAESVTTGTNTTASDTSTVKDSVSDKNTTEKKVAQEVEWEIDRVHGKKYLKLDGKRITGWQEYKGKRYFFDIQDGAAKTGFLNSSTSRYYFDKDGAQLLGWQKINDKVYYLTKDGEKKTGVFTDESKKYYLKDGIKEIGLKEVNGNWYYFTEDGSR